MSKLEQNHENPANALGKVGDCCGGAHDDETAKPSTHLVEHAKTPLTTNAGSHAHAPHGVGGSCGCGGKHK